jgi:transmembrane sensor
VTDANLNPELKPGRADRVEARASEYLLRRYDLNGWSDADQAELDAWLEESLSHRTSYWRLKAAWLRANRLDALRPMSPPAGSPATQRFLRSGLKLAAAVALVALLGGTGWYLSGPTTQTFATAIGERSNLKLPDGSHVELTTNTVLRVAKGGDQRSVWLDKGEAFFQVVHDDKRAFVLHALDFKVVDLGTEFSVRRYADRLEVTVLKGSVRIDPPEGQHQSAPVRLTAGEVAIADNHAISVTRKSQIAIVDALGWRSGILVFRRTPLSEVAAEFNRWNAEKIIIDDRTIADMTISARLSATDVDMFARMARNFMGLKVSRNGDEIRISRQGM